MRQTRMRISATILWLKARYDQFTSRPLGQVTFLVCFVLLGTLFFAHPAAACGITDPADCVLQAFLWITDKIAFFLTRLIVAVLDVLIPVMTYNNFSNAPVVTAGWALVRDTVNMFFVIVLIVIAFGTIFGHSKFKWQSQVPRLLLFAIVINFSKTLAGIMIDFGQVVMLTFANALREIAAGNIIELFGLNKVSQFSSTASAFDSTSGGSGAGGVELLLSNLAAIFILAWVLVIMLLLLAILLYRVVALWILIVIAPLAWFAGGAEILGSKAYADWWEQFKCLVAVGPIVTFFLWLALAVAGDGSAAEGFESTTAGSSTGFLTKIFEFQSLMSLVVGSAMIMAGLQTAQKFCSAMGSSFLGKSLGKAAAFGPAMAEVGKGAALKTFGWGARKVGGGARAVGRGAAAYGGAMAENVPGLRIATRRGRADMWRTVAEKSGSGVLGKTLGRYAEKRQGVLMGARHEEIAAAGEKYKKDSKENKLKQLQRFEKTGHKTLGGKREAQALFKEMIGDKDLQEKYVESGGDMGQLWKRYGSSMEQDFKGDSATLDKTKDFKKRYAHVTKSSGELKKFEDFENLSDEAMGDDDVRAQMANTKVEIKRKGKPAEVMTAADAAAKGYLGKDKQELFKGGYEAFSDEQLRRADTGSVAKSASLSTVSRAANLALKDKNVPRVNEMASELLSQYKDEKTTDAKRFEIAGVLDSLKAQFTVQLSSGDMKGVFEKQIKSLQQTIDTDRQSAEKATSKVGVDGKSVGSNFGKIPPVGQIPDPSNFVQKNFAGASAERVADAKRQVGEQMQEKNQSAYTHFQGMVAALEEKRGSLSSEAQGIRKEVDGLWDQFKEARKIAEQRVQQESQTFKSQAEQVGKEKETKSQEFDRAAKSGADLSDLSRMRSEMTALDSLKKSLEDQAAMTLASIDKDPKVVGIRGNIEIKEKQFSETLASKDNLKVDEDPAAKGLFDAMKQAEQERDKLKEALAALDGLRPPNA